VDQRARERQLLLHPFREQHHRVGPPVPKLEHLQHALRGEIRAHDAEQPRVDGEVGADGEVVPEAWGFRQEADPGPQRRAPGACEGSAVNRHGPFGGKNQPAEHPQGRRLAGAIGAEEAENLATGHVERDVLHRHAVAETPRDRLRRNHALMLR
jgi:hypothetical protein